jgi:hypothetical protein
MMTIKRLYEQLKSFSCVKYSNGESFLPLEDDLVNASIQIIQTDEMIKLQGQDQFVRLATYQERPTLFSYFGSNPKSMIQTIDLLKIPKSFKVGNLGQKAFHVFGMHLQGIENTPVHLQQQVVKGYENQFLMVLEKIAKVYTQDVARNCADDRDIESRVLL